MPDYKVHINQTFTRTTVLVVQDCPSAEAAKRRVTEELSRLDYYRHLSCATTEDYTHVWVRGEASPDELASPPPPNIPEIHR